MYSGGEFDIAIIELVRKNGSRFEKIELLRASPAITLF
jgi:hypothetical protein